MKKYKQKQFKCNAQSHIEQQSDKRNASQFNTQRHAVVLTSIQVKYFINLLPLVHVLTCHSNS